MVLISLARVGGDEFAVLAIETSRGDVATLLARLRKNLESHNAERNHRYRISVSIGVAYYNPKSPCSMHELMAQADKMMYAEKRAKQGMLVI